MHNKTLKVCLRRRPYYSLFIHEGKYAVYAILRDSEYALNARSAFRVVALEKGYSQTDYV